MGMNMSNLKTMRKPSMPKISLAYTAGVVVPRGEMSLASAAKLGLVSPTSGPLSMMADGGEGQGRERPTMPRIDSGLSVGSQEMGEGAVEGGKALPPAPANEVPEKGGFAAFGRLVRTKSSKSTRGRPVSRMAPS